MATYTRQIKIAGRNHILPPLGIAWKTNSQADRGSKLWKTYHIVGQFHFAFILCPEG